MKPFFSIVMPSYNSQEYISKAISSVLKQTYKNWELIIVDNFSSDNTIKIIRSFNCKKIKVFQIKNDGIIAKSRNFGIYNSSGIYISFLDSDDFWYPEKLEVCLKYIKSSHDFLCHSEIWSYQKNKKVFKTKKVIYGFKSENNFEKLLFINNCISTSAVTIKKEHLINVSCFNESKKLVTVEDYHLWLKVLKFGIKIKFIKQVLGEYVLHGENTSNVNKENINALSYAFESFYKNFKNKSFLIKLMAKRRRGVILYIVARSYQQLGDFNNSIKLNLKAILKWPFKLKFYLALFMSILRIK